ncbi:hypothetical protein EB796_010423 [Bugula neritina]|uniref:Uncharacterized protein n=1 Tax=Bugula neritina TaxID=10212 RepID=A0A7J7JZZ2_BUGNE|nr:hypothetical protein EB796_010423 [Bugula neritina]
MVPEDEIKDLLMSTADEQQDDPTLNAENVRQSLPKLQDIVEQVVKRKSNELKRQATEMFDTQNRDDLKETQNLIQPIINDQRIKTGSTDSFQTLKSLPRSRRGSADYNTRLQEVSEHKTPTLLSIHTMQSKSMRSTLNTPSPSETGRRSGQIELSQHSVKRKSLDSNYSNKSSRSHKNIT